MAPHSSTLVWKIPWAEEPGRLQSMGSLRVGHDWATSLSLFTFMHWRRKWQPTPVFLPGESQGWGAWWAAVYGVAQSRIWLKWLSSKDSRKLLKHLFFDTEVWKELHFLFFSLGRYLMLLFSFPQFIQPFSVCCNYQTPFLTGSNEPDVARAMF